MKQSYERLAMQCASHNLSTHHIRAALVQAGMKESAANDLAKRSRKAAARVRKEHRFE